MQLPYNDLSNYWKNKFGKKTFKIVLDGGFTCPNRDGFVGINGCIFCDVFGSISPQFRENRNQNLKEQIDNYITKSNPDKYAYVAYFQAFSGTYGDRNLLKSLYEITLNHRLISGLSIGTRPDCIDDEIVNILTNLNKIKPIPIELGIQTFNDDDLKFINRGHDSASSIKAIKKLKVNGIEVVVHLILGLPNENQNTIDKNVSLINDLKIDGVKFHELHILKNTILEKLFLNGEIKVLEQQDYITRVIYYLTHFRKEIVIHRLCANVQIKDELLAPLWTLKSGDTREEIIEKMNINKQTQGMLHFG